MPVLAEPPAVRVQDYLNDKFQTLADLDTLDALLVAVQTQQQQLRSQLTSAEAAADAAHATLGAHAQTLAAAAAGFQAAQADIDRRLLAAGTGDSVAAAAQQLDATVDKLRRLDVARGYVDLLCTVQQLNADATRLVGQGSPELALKPYTALQELARRLKTQNEAAESAAVHLVDYAEAATAELWRSMSAVLAARFEKVLAEIGWPAEKVVWPSEAVHAEFGAAFAKLLVLQGPCVFLPSLSSPLVLQSHGLTMGDNP